MSAISIRNYFPSAKLHPPIKRFFALANVTVQLRESVHCLAVISMKVARKGVNKPHYDGVKCPFRVRNNSKIRRKKKSLNPRQWEKSSSLTWRHIFLWYANFQTNSQQLKRWFMLAYRMYNFLCRKSKKPSFFSWCSIIIYIREKTIKEEEKNLNFHMPERQKDDCRCKKGWLVKKEGVVHYLISCENSHAK